MLNTPSLPNALPDFDHPRRQGGGGADRRCGCPHKTWKALVVLLAVVGMMFPGWGLTQAAAESATTSESTPAPLPQEKLDSLLAPIALYPDQLLAQTLMASTYPLDVVAAARFVTDNRDLKGDALDKAVAEKDWDPSVQSLTGFPQVLEMMNDKLDWTQELGNAFLADRERVMQTVQNLRQKAEAAGNLESNEQQTIVKEKQTIIIEPAKTEVVYVPTYNPTVVYGTWWAPAYPPYYYPPPAYYYPPGAALVAGAIGFGIGYAIADNHWGWSNCNWRGGDIDININKNNTFINNNAEFKNKVKSGNWKHNPSQRKGVAYGDAKTREQYRRSDPNAVSARRDARGYDAAEGRGGASRRAENAGTRDVQRPGSGGASQRGGGAGTRDVQRPGGDGVSQRGGSVGTRDVQRPGSGGASQRGGSAGTRDLQRPSSGSSARSSGARPSFDAGHSRQQARSFSSRGASSRASMGGGGRGGGGRGR